MWFIISCSVPFFLSFFFFFTREANSPPCVDTILCSVLAVFVLFFCLFVHVCPAAFGRAFLQAPTVSSWQGLIFGFFPLTVYLKQRLSETSHLHLNTYCLTLTGNVLGKFCGNVIPDSIGTSGNVALIRFVTDETLTASGFRLRFESSTEGKLIDSSKYKTTYIYHMYITKDRNSMRHWCYSN